MKLTGETITDEMIRELRNNVEFTTEGGEIYKTAQIALGNFGTTRMTADEVNDRIDAARARCAEILNARAEVKP